MTGGFQTFYRRSFDKDEERINKMFREAISHGVQIEKRFVW